MVFLYHLKIIPGGFLSVCAFFALSGYLCTFKALTKENFSIKNYYINAFKKLYLPVVVCVFLTIIFHHFFSNHILLNLKDESFSVLGLYNNFWQLSVNEDYFTKNINSPFIHLWYISILMQFELFFPIAYILLTKINKKFSKNISTIIISILAILSTAYFIFLSFTKDVMSVYYNSFARAFSILLGVLLALIHNKYNYKISNYFKNYKDIIFVFYFIAFILLNVFVNFDSSNYALFMIITTIISIRLIEYSLDNSKPNVFIKNFAKLTYLIYLFQYPIMFFMQNINKIEWKKYFIIAFLTLLISLICNAILEFDFKKKKMITVNIIKVILLILIIGSRFCNFD